MSNIESRTRNFEYRNATPIGVAFLVFDTIFYQLTAAKSMAFLSPICWRHMA